MSLVLFLLIDLCCFKTPKMCQDEKPIHHEFKPSHNTYYYAHESSIRMKILEQFSRCIPFGINQALFDRLESYKNALDHLDSLSLRTLQLN
jgi:hypothetical protein